MVLFNQSHLAILRRYLDIKKCGIHHLKCVCKYFLRKNLLSDSQSPKQNNSEIKSCLCSSWLPWSSFNRSKCCYLRAILEWGRFQIERISMTPKIGSRWKLVICPVEIGRESVPNLPRADLSSCISNCACECLFPLEWTGWELISRLCPFSVVIKWLLLVIMTKSYVDDLRQMTRVYEA